MIVNRNDYQMVDGERGFGVGHQLFNTSSFDPEEVNFVLALLYERQRHFGKGVVAVDCGANIGVHTVEWARFMHGWGSVIAIEAQERIYYALAGNIAINNCLNARAIFAAAGESCTEIRVPVPDYLVPSSFGSLELRPSPSNEFIGQHIDYSASGTQEIPQISLDSLNLARLDFVKIDVEGMELDVLHGASQALKARKPQLLIEVIKSDRAKLQYVLDKNDYQTFPLGINLLGVHRSDPSLGSLRVVDGALRLN